MPVYAAGKEQSQEGQLPVAGRRSPVAFAVASLPAVVFAPGAPDASVEPVASGSRVRTYRPDLKALPRQNRYGCHVAYMCPTRCSDRCETDQSHAESGDPHLL